MRQPLAAVCVLAVLAWTPTADGQTLLVRNARGEIVGPLLYVNGYRIVLTIPAAAWQHWNPEDTTPQIDRLVMVGVLVGTEVTLGQTEPPIVGTPPTFPPPEYSLFESFTCTGPAYMPPADGGTWLAYLLLSRNGYGTIPGHVATTRLIKSRWQSGRCVGLGAGVGITMAVADLQYVLLADVPQLASPFSVDLLPPVVVSVEEPQ